MKLSYRGIKYNQNHVAADLKLEYQTGKYRGGNCKIGSTQTLSPKKVDSPRVYRGINY